MQSFIVRILMMQCLIQFNKTIIKSNKLKWTLKLIKSLQLFQHIYTAASC